jgi:ABC-type glycerol-3-phosphate transport system substrate-binding protein
MKNNLLQIIIIGISAVAILVAVVMFSVFKAGGTGSNKIGTVIVWGTITQSSFDMIFQKMSEQGIKTQDFKYVEKSKETFEDELLRAIAENTGPDLVILNEKQIIENQNRIINIPFETYPLRNYQDSFIEEANLLVTRDGLLGFPLVVDPLVMYYNKNILTNNGFARVPETWSEMLALTPVMTVKDSSFNISKSTIALGAFDNISHAKDIFWMLTLQAGNPVIKRGINAQTGAEEYQSTFSDAFNFTLAPSYAALNFFTQFSNPTRTVYSWNRSLPNSQTMFVSGDLAFYIGYASELPTIQKLNPNLNFDIALMPQSQSSTRKTTYGNMSVLSIPRTSKNISGATYLISQLTSPEVQKILMTELNKASVRRDVLSMEDSSNPYQAIINRSAIMAQGVLEPDNRALDGIIKETIDTVVSGQFEISEAINRAEDKISNILIN